MTFRTLTLFLLLTALAACASVPGKRPVPSLTKPVEGLQTSGFSGGGPGRRKHDGLDISAPYGAPVVAVTDGRVIAAESYGAYGLIVRLDHGGGLRSMYAHLSVIDVRVGHEVKAGQKIGEIGTSGNATGPHLHLEMSRDGELIDPGRFFIYQEYRR
ncbi:M23 family metallopeptidase [Aquisalinus flavus]|uniref:M23ase beta-sheet core domain-containing protein n=1 Tax=Aquisalinus flavus TaxID=1526572 RepID=A0A8J2V5D7_9PROT|nr:M23 family metallopeptidase [Aquisalinus flavus]MBD0426569.1 M23 family metallopeptidase [Aquisalinus flavus]UNE47883.1 M23 family metallopeptidase [Aquisalinus flavus]GGD06923.1 hypothetical protein GCM10011342_14650 [Aquisalinus flavus]